MSLGRSPSKRPAEKQPGRNRKDALDAGATEHYSDARYYGFAYRKRVNDVEYYERLVQQHQALKRPSQRSKLTVLEYGAGSGRVTLPLARLGAHVTAVDVSAAMLTELEAALKSEPASVQKRVRTRLADMRSAKTRRQFDLVIAPFNTLLHLYTRDDMERFLSRVTEHLAPGGCFVFDYSLPRIKDLAPDPERWLKGARFRHPSNGQMVAYAERFHYAPNQQVLSVWMRFTPLDTTQSVWETKLTHRQYFPRELAALLHYNGFTDQRWTADFSEQELRSTSDGAVVVCCAPKHASSPTRVLRSAVRG